jgi:hypothetical protein
MKLLVTTCFLANFKGAISFGQTFTKQTKNMIVIFYFAIHYYRIHLIE